MKGTIKTPEELGTLKEGGALLARILREVAAAALPGVTTKGLDDLAEHLIIESGGEPSFKNYNPYGAKRAFPATLCVSLNDEVVHGIPRKSRILASGDIVGLDIGMRWPSNAKASSLRSRGHFSGVGKEASGRTMFTDTAITVGVGRISKEAENLIKVTRESLEKGILAVRTGGRIGDIGAAIQEHIERHGFGVVRDLAGHGVGYRVHEDPFVPNFGTRGKGEVLKEGMVLAIEPMATAGTWKVLLDDDEWTFKTADGKLAAHFEHTIVITKDGCEILTLPK